MTKKNQKSENKKMKNESYQFTAQILWLPQIAQKGQKGLKMTQKR